MSRYDYVKYDEQSTDQQAHFKMFFDTLSFHVDDLLKSPRAKALVHTNLEQAYMWVGKAIRDDQITRNGATELQEGRDNK